MEKFFNRKAAYIVGVLFMISSLTMFSSQSWISGILMLIATFVIFPLTFDKFSENLKSKLTKEWRVTIALILFIAASLFGQTDFDSTSKTVTAEKQVKNNNTEIVESVEVVTYYSDLQVKVFPPLQLSSQRIMEAGESGEQLQFESAQIKIQSAKHLINQAQEELVKLTPPAKAGKLHRLLAQTIEKQRQAVGLYEQGVDSLDPDLIYRGVELYQQSINSMREATQELAKLIK